jgi:hypothetical protein
LNASSSLKAPHVQVPVDKVIIREVPVEVEKVVYREVEVRGRLPERGAVSVRP